jgi:hypothetical protein
LERTSPTHPRPEPSSRNADSSGALAGIVVVTRRPVREGPVSPVPGHALYMGVILVLSEKIDAGGLCARDTGGPLADVAFHEMLHLCGDAVKAEDGIARHQLAGTELIRRLLGIPPLLP